MSDYSEFFLNSAASVVQLDCIEISHSLFTSTKYVVRNAVQGVTVIHEDATEHVYEYYPIRCSLTGPRDDLENAFRVEFGDLGEIIPVELDAIRADDGLAEYPIVKYRTYRSDVLTEPLLGPLLFEIRNFAFTRQGSQFEAKAPALNDSKTGETYKITRFPMLRGLL